MLDRDGKCYYLQPTLPVNFMGTAATLAIRHRGNTYYQHTSYDGYINTVLSRLAGTLAAAGPDIVRERLDLEQKEASTKAHSLNGQEETPNTSERIFLDRKTMGNAYLLSCGKRGQQAFHLDHTMTYDAGNPYFSQGGIIPLLAPIIDWGHNDCEKIEDANFILDLDRNLLLVPEWKPDIKEGSYDDGSGGVQWEINLNEIEGLNPEMLAYALKQASFTNEAPASYRKHMLNSLIGAVRNGEGELPDEKMNFYQSKGLLNRDVFLPTLHFLRGLPDHTIYIQALISFMRGMSKHLPVFSNKNTVLISNELTQENVLIVDLREGNVEAQNMVTQLLDAAAKYTGMIYNLKGRCIERTVSTTITSSSSMSNKTDQWDVELVPQNAVSVGLFDPIAAIKDEAKNDPEIGVYMLALAIIDFNGEQIKAIEESGVKCSMEPEQLASVVGVAVDMAKCFELAWTGSTANRWKKLDTTQQSHLLNAMSPIDRYTFEKLTTTTL